MARTYRAPKCQICREQEAEWAMQYIGEDTPTFSTLGSHYRGFRAVKVCDECKEERIVLEHPLYDAMSVATEGSFAQVVSRINQDTGIKSSRILGILEAEERSR